MRESDKNREPTDLLQALHQVYQRHNGSLVNNGTSLEECFDTPVEQKYPSNGDIDLDGLCIADRLWNIFGHSIQIWRMSPADYEKSLSKVKIGDIGRAKLENISHPILKNTAECMKEKQMAGYQENMLNELLKDMKS